MNEITITALDDLQKRLEYLDKHVLMSPVSDSDFLEAIREVVSVQMELVKYLNKPNIFEPYYGDGTYPTFKTE